MFGLYDIRMPTALMQKAGARQGRAGAYAMGLLVGVVAAPCVGPVVLGLLAFVAATQDAALGFLFFFVLSLGLGLPYPLPGGLLGKRSRPFPAPEHGWKGSRKSSGGSSSRWRPTSCATRFPGSRAPGCSRRFSCSAALALLLVAPHAQAGGPRRRGRPLSRGRDLLRAVEPGGRPRPGLGRLRSGEGPHAGPSGHHGLLGLLVRCPASSSTRRRFPTPASATP